MIAPPVLSKHTSISGNKNTRKTHLPPYHVVLVTVLVSVLSLLGLPCPAYAFVAAAAGAQSSTYHHPPEDDSIGQLSTILSSLYQMQASNAFGMTTSNGKDDDELTHLNTILHVDANRFVPLEIIAANEAVVYDVLHQAEQVGFVITLVYRNIIAGKVPILKLPDLALVPNIALLLEIE
jgi:hypothetical protein